MLVLMHFMISLKHNKQQVLQGGIEGMNNKNDAQTIVDYDSDFISTIKAHLDSNEFQCVRRSGGIHYRDTASKYGVR